MLKRLIICLLLFTTPTFAVEPDEILPDAGQEARAREISTQLRCLVCRNENIDSSNAGIAKDLRVLVRERIVAGDTNEETIDAIVDRYGEFVLLQPRFSLTNFFLWAAGPLMLLIGGFLAWRFSRGHSRLKEAPLSKDENKRLEKLLED